MQDIICAICKRRTKYKLLYESTFDPKYVTAKTYTSRRIPDKIHYKIVRCTVCGLTYSNPIYNPSKIINFYKQSLNPEDNDLKNSAKVSNK